MLPELYEGDAPFAFLDYALCDMPSVAAIAQELHRRGVLMWHDEGCGYDRLFPESVADRVKACSVFLLFLSQKGLQYEQFRRLFNYAIYEKRPIIPIYLEEVQLAKGWQLQFHYCGPEDNAVFADDPAFFDRLHEMILSLIH